MKAYLVIALVVLVSASAEASSLRGEKFQFEESEDSAAKVLAKLRRTLEFVLECIQINSLILKRLQEEKRFLPGKPTLGLGVDKKFIDGDLGTGFQTHGGFGGSGSFGDNHFGVGMNHGVDSKLLKPSARHKVIFKQVVNNAIANEGGTNSIINNSGDNAQIAAMLNSDNSQLSQGMSQSSTTTFQHSNNKKKNVPFGLSKKEMKLARRLIRKGFPVSSFPRSSSHVITINGQTTVLHDRFRGNRKPSKHSEESGEKDTKEEFEEKFTKFSEEFDDFKKKHRKIETSKKEHKKKNLLGLPTLLNLGSIFS